MKFSVITLFPELIDSYTCTGVVGQARSKNLIEITTINPRKFTKDVHHTVDDRPFGGGDGMVMKPEPLVSALDEASRLMASPRRVYLSPQGKVWDNSMAQTWAEEKRDTVLLSGRYGGIDQRVINDYIDEEVSIGDYVLSGGELPALALVDSVARFLDGVLGNRSSSQKDSFSNGLLECPQFTRPRNYLDKEVPEFLLSGDHEKIEKIRSAISIVLTSERRPELLSTVDLATLGDARKIVEQLSSSDKKVCGLEF